MKNKKNKKSKLVKFLPLLLIFGLLFSCKSNFTGGISGTVYEQDGTTVYPNVYVYAYTSKSDMEEDFNNFAKEASGEAQTKLNIDANNNFVPRSGKYVMRTQTNTSGSFTITKIAWQNTKPRFGKDDDTCDVYLLFFHENSSCYESVPTDSDKLIEYKANKNGLWKYDYPVTIMSGSTNQSSVTMRIRRGKIVFSGLSGYIRTKEDGTSNLGKAADDEVQYELCYWNPTGGEKGAGAWKGVYSDYNRSCGLVTTHVTTAGDSSSDSNSPYETHGNYSGLGTGYKFPIQYQMDGTIENKEAPGYIWLALKKYDSETGTAGDGTKAFKISISDGSNSLVKNFSTADFKSGQPGTDDPEK